MRQQVLDHVDLVRDLGAAQDRHERPCRVGDGVAQVLDLLLDQEAHDLGLAAHGLGHGDHRGVRAVAGAEGVVAVDVGHVGQRLGECGVALLLAGVEPQVLQHQDVARGQRRGFRAGVSADHVGGERNRFSQQLGQLVGRRLHAVLRVRSVLGPSQVAHQDQPSAAVDHGADRRQRHANPPVVGDLLLVIQRHIEIDAHQHGLAGDIDILNRLLRHSRLPSRRESKNSVRYVQNHFAETDYIDSPADVQDPTAPQQEMNTRIGP